MYLLMLFVCQFVSVVLVFSVALPLLSFYIEMDFFSVHFVLLAGFVFEKQHCSQSDFHNVNKNK